MLLEGGTFVLPSQPLPNCLVQKGVPSLVLCDADFISLFPKFQNKIDDAHFVHLPPCMPGVWITLLDEANNASMLINLAGLEDVDENVLRSQNWQPLQNQKWKSFHSALQVDHGNLFVFPSFAYPASPPEAWYGDWINRCFDLTFDKPLDVTGDVIGPVGSIWRLPEESTNTKSIQILTNKTTEDVIGVRINV